MTALPAVKREALRFRIWQFAAPREWDVTIKEIAEAVGAPLMSARNVVVNAGWMSRVRVMAAGPDGFGARNAGHRNSERYVVDDVLAGRVEAGTL